MAKHSATSTTQADVATPGDRIGANLFFLQDHMDFSHLEGGDSVDGD
jgi:hypothetical protein